MTLNELFSRKDPYNLVLALTPKVAEDWLNHCNTANRDIVDSHVDYLAGEMKAGRWQLTHQGIAFSDNRVLLDGQHRLWAVITSGVTVPMRVFVNEQASAMSVLDTGKRRSNDQIISLTGGLGQVTVFELAVLRAMLAGSGRRTKRSAALETQSLIEHREPIQFALEAFAGARRFRGVATAAIVAVVARAWYSSDRNRLRHFADVLRTGTPKGDHDQPIMLLFQFLISSREGRRDMSFDRECHGKTERALATFLSCEKLNRLYPATKELFPLPQEMKAVA